VKELIMNIVLRNIPDDLPYQVVCTDVWHPAHINFTQHCSDGSTFLFSLTREQVLALPDSGDPSVPVITVRCATARDGHWWLTPREVKAIKLIVRCHVSATEEADRLASKWKQQLTEE
jgi:hypothetical protein